MRICLGLLVGVVFLHKSVAAGEYLLKPKDFPGQACPSGSSSAYNGGTCCLAGGCCLDKCKTHGSYSVNEAKRVALEIPDGSEWKVVPGPPYSFHKLAWSCEVRIIKADIGYWGTSFGNQKTSIDINGYGFAFWPGYGNGIARIFDVFGNSQNLGWTPAASAFHRFEVTLRSSGTNNMFKIIDGSTSKTWQKQFDVNIGTGEDFKFGGVVMETGIETSYSDSGTHKAKLLSSSCEGPTTAPTPAPTPAPTVQPFDCVSNNSPIQVLSKDGGSTFNVKALEIETGIYTQLYQFPLDYIPGLTNVNGVGINPKDGKPYCTISYNGYHSYIARFDSSTIEFIAKIPSGGKPSYNTAAFTESGDYVLPKGGTTNLYVFKSAAILGATGFASPASAGLADWTVATPLALTLAVKGADIAAFKGDFEGTGSEQDYAMELHSSTKGRVTLYNLETGSNWYLDASDTDSSEFVSAATYGWGAAWTYGNEIYFSHNGGLGVFKVFQNTIDIGEKRVTVIRVGSSTATSMNDGMNCLLAESPWTNPPTPAPTPGSCWTRHPIQYLTWGNTPDQNGLDLAGAKAKCLAQGAAVCKGVTCEGTGSTPCTVRGGVLKDAVGNEPVAYTPSDCTPMLTRAPTPKPTTATTPAPTPGRCWTRHPSKYMSWGNTPDKNGLDLAGAKAKCLAQGAAVCKGLTCGGSSSTPCTVRGGVLDDSPSGEEAYTLSDCTPECEVTCSTGLYDAQRGVCIECKDGQLFDAATGACTDPCDD